MADAGPRPGRRFREVLGLGTKFAQGEPGADLQLLTDLGVRWVRDTVDWSVMEPIAGTYIDFPPEFRARLDFYKAHDIGLVFLLAYDDWVAHPPNSQNPTAAFDAVAFGNYARQMAERLRSTGVRFVLELWNEPHNMVLRPALGGAWNGQPPSPWLDYYVRMVGEAVRQVKAFDSSIRLLDDDDMWVLHYWFLEAGLPSALDGFAVHPYVGGFPERAAIDENTDWMKPFVGVDADGSFSSAMRRLRAQGAQKLGRTPEMWITEWGWPVDQANSSGTSLSEDTVAAWLPRAFVLAEAAGAETLCWFSAQDSVDGPMGLTTNDGRKRKPYLSFKALSDNFGDYFYMGQVAGADHPASGTQAFLFRRDTSLKIVAWTVEPTATRLQLDGALQSATLMDSFGQPLRASGDVSGAYVTLGAAPVFLEFPLQSTALSLDMADTSALAP